MLKESSVDILVVEDNPSERASIVGALERAIPDVQVASVHDGTQAVDFLFARGAYADRVGEDPPTLVLLDLEMPGADGFSVLAEIRELEPKDALTLTPVVIFTDSMDANSIQKSYRCGANSYVIKPVSSLDFQSIVEKIGYYWMTCNQASV